MLYRRHWRSIIGERFPRTSHDEEAYDGGRLRYYTAANLRDLIAPWFEVTQINGVPSGPHTGKGARLIGLLLPLGDRRRSSLSRHRAAGAPQGDRLRFDKQAPGVIDAVQEIWPTQRGEVFIDGPSGALPVPVVIDD